MTNKHKAVPSWMEMSGSELFFVFQVYLLKKS